MAGFSLDVRSDVSALIRRNNDLREQLLRAAANAVNAAAADVRKTAIDEIAARNKEFSKATVRGYVTLRKAKYTKSRLRSDGEMRVNYGGITATIIAAGKAPNLIYFVPAASRFPAAFRQVSGVAAHAAGRTTVYDGSFIVKAKNGKMVVVTRSAKAKTSPSGMRYKRADGKWAWKEKWSKGLYGPPLKALMANRQTHDAMDAKARAVWPAHWRREVEKVLLRAGRI